MENNEMMTMEEEVLENTTTNDEGFELGAGLAMLIGSGLTLAAIAGGKKLKLAWEAHKAKKQLAESVENQESDICEVVDDIEE